jgi:hypothetical protein
MTFTDVLNVGAAAVVGLGAPESVGVLLPGGTQAPAVPRAKRAKRGRAFTAAF